VWTNGNNLFPFAPLLFRYLKFIYFEFSFGHLFANSQFRLAACVHPYFKFNWLGQRDSEQAKQKLRQLMHEAKLPVNERMQQSTVGDWFDFAPREEAAPDENQTIKQLFIKFNTAIPSSAPVERFFSQAALILTVRRNRLSDTLLEILILLKIAYKNQFS